MRAYGIALRAPRCDAAGFPASTMIGRKMLSLGTLRGYCRTDYVVRAEDVLQTLRVARCHPEFDLWLEARGERRWAYVTAENPRSFRQSAEENQLRQRDLRNRLDAENRRWRPAESVGWDGDWPPENGALVLGIEPAEAMSLGRDFEQFAVLVGELAGPATLAFPFFDEALPALRQALTSADPSLHWTARHALPPTGDA